MDSNYYGLHPGSDYYDDSLKEDYEHTEHLQRLWVEELNTRFPTGLTPEQKKWLKDCETFLVTGLDHFLKRLKGEPSTLPSDPVFRENWEDSLLNFNTFYQMYGFPPKPTNRREDHEMSCELWRIWRPHRKLWIEMYRMVREYQIKSSEVKITEEVVPRLKRRNARED